jgi:hypothetical protein
MANQIKAFLTNQIFQRSFYSLLLTGFYFLHFHGRNSIGKLSPAMITYLILLCCIVGVLLLQIIKNSLLLWKIVLGLACFYSCWMFLAFLSDLKKPGPVRSEFIIGGTLFMTGCSLILLILYFIKPKKEVTTRIEFN